MSLRRRCRCVWRSSSCLWLVMCAVLLPPCPLVACSLLQLCVVTSRCFVLNNLFAFPFHSLLKCHHGAWVSMFLLSVGPNFFKEPRPPQCLPLDDDDDNGQLNVARCTLAAHKYLIMRSCQLAVRLSDFPAPLSQTRPSRLRSTWFPLRFFIIFYNLRRQLQQFTCSAW